jgi:hypothetical protein
LILKLRTTGVFQLAAVNISQLQPGPGEAAMASVPAELDTPNDGSTGGGIGAGKLNVQEFGLTTKESGVTVRDTEIVKGLFEAAGAATVITQL